MFLPDIAEHQYEGNLHNAVAEGVYFGYRVVV
jgi:hypothetical protein